MLGAYLQSRAQFTGKYLAIPAPIHRSQTASLKTMMPSEWPAASLGTTSSPIYFASHQSVIENRRLQVIIYEVWYYSKSSYLFHTGRCVDAHHAIWPQFDARNSLYAFPKRIQPERHLNQIQEIAIVEVVNCCRAGNT